MIRAVQSTLKSCCQNGGMCREFFSRPALEVAPQLLGAHLTSETPEGVVTIRITEVEAYHGLGTGGPYDPGSHARDRRTPRNASMFGPPGHAYVYLSYGVHFAINLVCSPDGIASGVLLRSGEVIEGKDLAMARRMRKRPPTATAALRAHLLAQGPGNLGAALGVTRETHDGLDLFAPPFHVALAQEARGTVVSGPRVGVSGVAGTAEFPWRFWIAGDPTVSRYRPGTRHITPAS